MAVHLRKRDALEAFLTLDIHDGMAQLQRNPIVVEALHDVSLESAGIRHELRHDLDLRTLEGHPSRHDEANVSGSEDHHLPSRHEALHVNETLRRTCREDTGRTITRNVECASRPLTAAHRQYDGLRLDLEEPLLTIHRRHHLRRTDIHDHGVQLILDVQRPRLVDEASCVLRSGQLLLKGMQSEAVMDTLVQNTAQFLISLEDEDTVHAAFLRRNRSSQSCRSSAYNYDVIRFHVVLPPSYNESLLVPTTIFESPPDFVMSNMLTCRSRARISMVLGEQKPA